MDWLVVSVAVVRRENISRASNEGKIIVVVFIVFVAHLDPIT